MKRAQVNAKKPLLLTLKLKSKKWNLRCGEIAKGFKASAKAAQKFGLRIVHYSIQGDHLHIIAEAKDNESLSRGMRSFGARLGKAIRAVVGGTGPVFLGRFHLRVLSNPTQMRNALAYVLQNFAKHTKLLKHLDEFSSAPYFSQWKKLLGRNMGPILEDVDEQSPPIPDYLCEARSWLAREGWMRAKILVS